MNPPHPFDAFVGRLRTRMGAAYPGTRAVFRGHDLHESLRDLDWIELYVFGITGRRYPPEAVRLLHAIWVYTSYPDARLWNNRVAALAGTTRSTPALALGAAIAVSEATIYGGGPGARAFEFVTRAQRRVAAGEPLTEIVREELQQRRVYGYGRPINSVDERLPWLKQLVAELGLADGPHYRLAFAIEETLAAIGRPLKMNYASISTALLADLGFSAIETRLFRSLMFVAGMPPGYVEALEEPSGSRFALRCSDLAYEGKPPRPWPAKGRRADAAS